MTMIITYKGEKQVVINGVYDFSSYDEYVSVSFDNSNEKGDVTYYYKNIAKIEVLPNEWKWNYFTTLGL